MPDAASDAETTADVATATAAPASGGFLGALSRFFGTGRHAQTADPAAAEAPVDDAAVTAAPGNLSAEDVASQIPQAAFATEELGPPPAAPDIATVASAAIAASETTARETRASIGAAAARVPAPARPAEDGLRESYVQVGLFSVQENAETAGETLRSAGLVPTLHEERGNGRRYWRLVVGPAPSAEDRAAVLETVRGVGFEDAYFVAR